MRNLNDIEAEMIQCEHAIEYLMSTYKLLWQEKQAEVDRTYAKLHGTPTELRQMKKVLDLELKENQKGRKTCKGCYFERDEFIISKNCPIHKSMHDLGVQIGAGDYKN